MQGWLHKRGPLLDWAWSRRWCVLKTQVGEYGCRGRREPMLVLQYFVDESLDDKRGEIVLYQESRAIPFCSMAALGDGVKHVSARPCGFTLDVDCMAGRERHLYYFDACDQAGLERWMSAIERSCAEAASCNKGVLQRASVSSQIMAMHSSIPHQDQEAAPDDEDFAVDVDELPECCRASAPVLERRRGALSAEAYGEWNAPRDIEPERASKAPAERMFIQAALQRSPFLASLVDREDDLETAIDAFRRAEFPAGAEVIRQGDSEDLNFYILESGCLDIFVRRGPAEKHPGRKVRTVCCGDSFGELSMLHRTPRAATLVAKDPCWLWSLNQQAFAYVMRVTANSKRGRHFKFLRSIKLLEKLSDGQLGSLLDATTTSRYRKGEYIVRAGEMGNCFYVVEEGEAMARINGMDARSYRRGGYFGELSLINDRPRAADVVASSEQLVVVSLDRGSFERILGKGVLFGPQAAPEQPQKPAASPRKPAAAEVADLRSSGYVSVQKLRALIDEQHDLVDGASDGSRRSGGGYIPVACLENLLAEAEKESVGDSKGPLAGFVHVDQLRKLVQEFACSVPPGWTPPERPGYVPVSKVEQLIENEARGEGRRGVSFDPGAAGAPRGEVRRGTGFVQPLVAGREAEEEGAEVAEEGSVRFDEESAAGGAQRPKLLRQGTGFVRRSEVRRLLEAVGQAAEGAPDAADGVRFEGGAPGAAEARAPMRKGTGYVHADELRRLLEGAEPAPRDDDRGVIFEAGAAEAGPGSIARRGTGFISAGPLRRLLEDAEAQCGRVTFDAADEGSARVDRRGSCFVQAVELQKLLDDDEAEAAPRVRFDPDAAEAPEGGGLARRGTGFVQAEQVRLLVGSSDHDNVGRVRLDRKAEKAVAKMEARDGPSIARRGTGFIQAELVSPEAGAEAEEGGVGQVRFDASADEAGQPGASPARRGTGFIQADQAEKLSPDADAEAEEGGGGKVRFDASADEAGRPGAAPARRGTGFVHAEQAEKLAGAADEGDGEAAAEVVARVHFDEAEAAPTRSRALVRQGTGFVQAEQARRWAGEGEEEGGGGVRFDVAAEEPERGGAKLSRQGTGFIQAEQAQRLACEEEEVGRGVRFDATAEEPASGGAKLARQGTGFIQAEQAQRLAGEEEEAEDEDVGRGVHFDAMAEASEGSGAKLSRQGTGFIQAEQAQRLAGEEEEEEDEDVGRGVRFDAAAEEPGSGGTKLSRQGTGSIQAAQAQRLAPSEEEAEPGEAQVRFDAGAEEAAAQQAARPPRLLRAGTGFAQAEVLRRPSDDAASSGDES